MGGGGGAGRAIATPHPLWTVGGGGGGAQPPHILCPKIILIGLLIQEVRPWRQLLPWSHFLESAPAIVNECNTIMVNQLLRYLLDEIRTNSNMFAILAGETRDVSNCMYMY